MKKEKGLKRRELGTKAEGEGLISVGRGDGRGDADNDDNCTSPAFHLRGSPLVA